MTPMRELHLDRGTNFRVLNSGLAAFHVVLHLKNAVDAISAC